MALTLIGPVCAIGGFMLYIGSKHVKRDITLVIEDVLERHAEGERRQSGREVPALQIHNLDFFYGANQVLFDINLEVARGEILALLGTNGAGKSTLLRAVSGLDHPHRGVIRIFGVNCTYLEPEQIIDQKVALLVGGKMTFPGLTVRDNLRIGAHSLRGKGTRSKDAMHEALEHFPELGDRLDQPAGTLSGGEQQMLALARVMMTAPEFLLIDELALGLAPKAVDRLMDIVREVNARGTTVILVEQSVNRAMSLAERAVFIERGEVRFDGPPPTCSNGTTCCARCSWAPPPPGSSDGLTVSIPSFVLVQGVITGLGYGLLAMGLVLIYKTNRILNFAQGQLGVVAAVFMVKCFYDFGFNYWFALVLSVVLAGAVGALSELLLRRIFNRPRVLVMVATIGLSQVLFVFTALPFIRPKNLYKPFPVPFDISFHIGTYLFTPGEVMTLVLAPLVAMALAVFVKWSPWGLAMRAMAENADSARLSGVWVRRTSTVAWTVAGVLSAFTAILAAPGQTSSLTEVLSPELLLLALTAAMVGAMVNLTAAFVAAIAVGVIQEVLVWNLSSTAQVDLILFAIVSVVLLVRIAALQTGSRTGGALDVAGGHEEPPAGRRAAAPAGGDHRGGAGRGRSPPLLPLVLNTGRTFLLSQICIYAVIALSLTVLTGWAGQVSLGQFGLVACGAIMASHLGASVPLILLMPFAGAVTAVIAVVVGLPALRVRGLYLAVSTLAFALWLMGSVLDTTCWTVPLVGRQLCTGLPNPQSTLIARPDLLGIGLGSERAFAWFSLGVLVVSVLMVRLWRDKGVARRLMAVRDNETTAGAMGIPLARTKLLAFALSGFIAGYAGVCLAFATERFSTSTFDPSYSILVVSMVVIGGLGSIDGAVLGAIYLVGLPAMFGTTPTIQFLSSGLGLLAFVLYLPGGLAELLHRFGDLVTDGVERLMGRGSGLPPPDVAAPEPAPTVAEEMAL